jgi:hypothetical protein
MMVADLLLGHRRGVVGEGQPGLRGRGQPAATGDQQHLVPGRAQRPGQRDHREHVPGTRCRREHHPSAHRRSSDRLLAVFTRGRAGVLPRPGFWITRSPRIHQRSAQARLKSADVLSERSVRIPLVRPLLGVRTAPSPAGGPRTAEDRDLRSYPSQPAPASMVRTFSRSATERWLISTPCGTSGVEGWNPVAAHLAIGLCSHSAATRPARNQSTVLQDTGDSATKNSSGPISLFGHSSRDAKYDSTRLMSSTFNHSCLDNEKTPG